jgi:hypothetical protein
VGLQSKVTNFMKQGSMYRGSDLTLEQNSQYSVLRCASQDHC